MLDLTRYVFAYAQALDNSGNTDYWFFDTISNKTDKIDELDPRLQMIRKNIDNMNQKGRVWLEGERGLVIKINLSGKCILKINPVSKDIADRTSAVVFLCNFYSLNYEHLPVLIELVEEKFGRELAQENINEILKIKRYLKWPSWILFLNFLFFSRKLR